MIEDTCIIPLGKRSTHHCRVSQRDFAAVTKWLWNWKTSTWKYGRKVYARRGGGAGYPTIYMHEFILRVLMGDERPSPLHTVHHKNGDSLDNTRGNLCWATKHKQSAEQKRRIPMEGRRIMDEARMAA